MTLCKLLNLENIILTVKWALYFVEVENDLVYAYVQPFKDYFFYALLYLTNF